MSDRIIETNLTNSTDTHVNASNTAPTPEEFKRRLARVLDRGWAVDRLSVDLPSDVHGEWIARDPQSVARAEMLGFSVDKQYAVNRKLNDTGDGSAVISDVMFMTQPMWMHEMIVQQRAEEYKKNHLQTRQKEERDFANSNQTIDMPASVESQATQVTGQDIAEALKPNPVKIG